VTAYLLKFLGIYFACLFKFIAGPVLGYAIGYNLWEIIFVSVSGMMTTVFFLTYLGEWIKRFWKVKVSAKKKLFTPRIRRTVKIWQKFGAPGIAAITPVFLTPIGGTILMNAFGVKKNKIFLYMFISAMLWAIIFGLSIQEILKIPFFRYLLG
jgi:uncharacterized membrane protein